MGVANIFSAEVLDVKSLNHHILFLPTLHAFLKPYSTKSLFDIYYLFMLRTHLSEIIIIELNLDEIVINSYAL